MSTEGPPCWTTWWRVSKSRQKVTTRTPLTTLPRPAWPFPAGDGACAARSRAVDVAGGLSPVVNVALVTQFSGSTVSIAASGAPSSIMLLIMVRNT